MRLALLIVLLTAAYRQRRGFWTSGQDVPYRGSACRPPWMIFTVPWEPC